MKNPRYYSLRVYGIGPFPKFYDCFKTMVIARQWAKMAFGDGAHTIEILREVYRGEIFGVERELIETIRAKCA